MLNAIKIMRQETLLCQRLATLFGGLRKALLEDTSGNNVSKAVQDMEPVLSEFAKLLKTQQDFLQKKGKTDMGDFLSAQPDSTEKNVALRMHSQLQKLQEELRNQSEGSQELLKRSKEFIDFHINVMAQTTASPAYGPPGGNGLGNQRGRQVFDANV